MKQNKINNHQRIQHALEAIEWIEAFSENHTLRSFLKDQKTISACLYQYTIIGEAIAGMEQSFLQKYDYPWFKVKSFRNFILHEYHAIEMRIIWDTTTEILPELKDLLKKMLKET